MMSKAVLWFCALAGAWMSGTAGFRLRRVAALRNDHASGRALVSLLYGNSAPSLLSVRTMMSSARRQGLKAHRIVMTTQGGMSTSWREILESDGVEVVEVPGIDVPEAMAGMAAKRWSKIMTKFMAFNLTMYKRVLMVDNDAFFAGAGDPNDIFEECGGEELCLVEDGMPEKDVESDCPEDPSLCRQLNTGVMVFTPSQARLEHILQEMQKDVHTYHLPDQQFFSRYLRSGKLWPATWKLLDRYWNCCGYAQPEDPRSRPWIGHFCGGWVRPFNAKFCTHETTCPPKLRAWQVEAQEMDSCLQKQTPVECAARKGCAWHGVYCMDERVPTKDITFDQEQRVD